MKKQYEVKQKRESYALKSAKQISGNPSSVHESEDLL